MEICATMKVRFAAERWADFIRATEDPDWFDEKEIAWTVSRMNRMPEVWATTLREYGITWEDLCEHQLIRMEMAARRRKK